MLALVPSTGLGAVTGGGCPDVDDVTTVGDGACCWSSPADGGGGPPCSKIRWRWARRSMLAKRYAAAALGVYDLGNVGGGVGLDTPPPPPPPTVPFSPPPPLIIAVVVVVVAAIKTDEGPRTRTHTEGQGTTARTAGEKLKRALAEGQGRASEWRREGRDA